MKREWKYSSVGLAIWALFYIMFLYSTAEAQPILSLIKETLIVQLFILFLPGLILGIVFHEIGALKDNQKRRSSLIISAVIIVAFLLVFRLLYL